MSLMEAARKSSTLLLITKLEATVRVQNTITAFLECLPRQGSKPRGD